MTGPDTAVRIHRWLTYVVTHRSVRITIETHAATKAQAMEDAGHLIAKVGLPGVIHSTRRVPDYRDGRAEGQLDDHDWVQLDRAAAGSVSGIEDWPHLRVAIQKVLGYRQVIETLHQVASPSGIAAIAGTVAPPPPHPVLGGVKLDGLDKGLTIGDAATAPSNRNPPQCPNCGNYSKPTDPAHNSKREWTCTKPSCGYMFSVPLARPADHIAVIQPLYNNQEPIEDQLAKVRTIYSYACFVHACRHINRRSGPLPDDATCEKCGASLQGSTTEHPESIRSNAPGTGCSPDVPPPAAPGSNP